jgi:hypothetical protein
MRPRIQKKRRQIEMKKEEKEVSLQFLDSYGSSLPNDNDAFVATSPQFVVVS